MKMEELLLAELTDIGIRTIGHLATDWALDHYLLASDEDYRWMNLAIRLPNEDTRQEEVSRGLLRELMQSSSARLPKIVRQGGLTGAPMLTRIVVRLSDGDLLLVAFRGSLNAWVARKLAIAIERELTPPHRPVVFGAVASSCPGAIVAPGPLATPVLALNSWQWRASRKLRLPAH